MSLDENVEPKHGRRQPSANRDRAEVKSDATIAMQIVPVVLSGGGGTRLWPCSTSETPKQFLNLVGERSLFEETLSRVSDRERFSPPIVVASEGHAVRCEDLLRSFGSEARLILEPCPRNTAAAVVLAACVVRAMHGDEALMLVMPSDHAIDDLDRFDQAVELGRRAAAADKLVTFGIHPATPETGYGYIETGPEIPQVPGVHEVARFVEKPALAEAEAMVADGNHLWNAGIFLFKVGTILSEFDKFEPEIRGCAERSIELAERNGIAILAKRAEFERCPSDSIDYAVMERSASIAVVPMSPGWSDVGSWDAIAQMQTANAPGDLITALDCTGCYIRSDGLKVAALGLKDLIVVVSGEGLLILPRGRSQEVKKLLSAMDTTAA